MQRLLAWAARDRTDDAIATSIEAAVRADTEGDYALAVDLYATGIEKMMSKLQRTYVKTDDEQLRATSCAARLLFVLY